MDRGVARARPRLPSREVQARRPVAPWVLGAVAGLVVSSAVVLVVGDDQPAASGHGSAPPPPSSTPGAQPAELTDRGAETSSRSSPRATWPTPGRSTPPSTGRRCGSTNGAAGPAGSGSRTAAATAALAKLVVGHQVTLTRRGPDKDAARPAAALRRARRRRRRPAADPARLGRGLRRAQRRAAPSTAGSTSAAPDRCYRSPSTTRLVAREGPGERAGAVRRRAQVDRVADQLGWPARARGPRPCPSAVSWPSTRPRRDGQVAHHGADQVVGHRAPRPRRTAPGRRRRPRCAASRSASAPALWNAMSEESTLCALPPVSVTRMSTIGWPAQPRSIWARTPFSTDGDELPGHDAADHPLGELEPGAPGQRLDLDLADGVLAVAAGLLDVPAEPVARRRRGSRAAAPATSTCSTDTPNRSRQPLERGVRVRLAHRPEHELLGLGLDVDAQRRVLGGQPGERGRELVLVGLGRRLDRHRQQRRRQRPRPQHARVLDRGEGVAGLGAGQPADGGDVAARPPASPGCSCWPNG